MKIFFFVLALLHIFSIQIETLLIKFDQPSKSLRRKIRLPQARIFNVKPEKSRKTEYTVACGPGRYYSTETEMCEKISTCQAGFQFDETHRTCQDIDECQKKNKHA